MAKADLIARALLSLEETCEAHTMLLEVLSDVGGDNPPPLLVVVTTAFENVQRASEALADAVRHQALPYLRDLDRVHVNGGMGAVAPMVTQKVVRQSSSTRT